MDEKSEKAKSKKAWLIYCQLPLEDSLTLKYYKLIKNDNTMVICPPSFYEYEYLTDEGVKDINVINSREELKGILFNSKKNNIVYLQVQPLLLNERRYIIYEEYKILDKYYVELLKESDILVEQLRLTNSAAEDSLVYLMNILRILRSEKGCPWDKKQTHESLKPFLLEEAYEVLEAIDKKSTDELCEELGDLLLQVIFHTRIAEEKGLFYINNVIRGLENKIIRRHPHVFGEGNASSVNDVIRTWEEIKKNEEKKQKKEKSKNLSSSKHLPALLRAEKMQDEASKVGFDWHNIEGAFDKLKEEAGELENAYMAGDQEKIEEEVGDLLFSVVNVARFLNLSPEMALNKTIDKFYSRFTFIEKNIGATGMEVSECGLKELDKLWEKAKKSGF